MLRTTFRLRKLHSPQSVSNVIVDRYRSLVIGTSCANKKYIISFNTWRAFSARPPLTKKIDRETSDGSNNRCIPVTDKPIAPSVSEIVKAFPGGVKKLYIDFKTTFFDGYERKSSLMVILTGRRLVERKRRLREDLKKVVVPVIGWCIIPILGNLFIIMAIMSPRFFLSRHFLSEEHVRFFASEEVQIRRESYDALAENFWSTCAMLRIDPYWDGLKELKPLVKGFREGTNMSSNSSSNSNSRLKSSSNSSSNSNFNSNSNPGPVIRNILPLFHIFSRQNQLMTNPSISSKLSTPRNFFVARTFPFPSLQLLPSAQLVTLARSAGLDSPILPFLPNAFVRRRLMAKAENVCRDDTLLIEEGHHLHGGLGCGLLTKEEVLEACVLRGLPVSRDLSTNEMRIFLTDHLLMMEQILKRKNKNVFANDDARVFVLHLPAIRLSLGKIL